MSHVFDAKAGQFAQVRQVEVIGRKAVGPIGILLVVLAYLLIGIGRPSPWWDEAVTRDVIVRPLGEILLMTREIDMVHLLYYGICHGLWVLAGSPQSSEHVYLLLRVSSACYMSGASAILFILAKRIGSTALAVPSTLIFASTLSVTRYGQEARSPALVTLLAVTTVLLADLMLDPRESQRLWRWRFMYASTTILMLGSNLLSGLILVVHLVQILSAPTPIRRGALPWLLVPPIVLSPYAFIAAQQTGQISWIERPNALTLLRLLPMEIALAPIVATLLTSGLILLARDLIRLRKERAPLRRDGLVLGTAWGLLIPAILWTISQFKPMFMHWYLTFTVPGVAILIVAVLSRGGRWLMALGTATLCLFGVLASVPLRAPMGHSENLREDAEYLLGVAQPGDSILFETNTPVIMPMAYPEILGTVVDIAQLQGGGSRAGEMFRSEVSEDELRRQLLGHDRVWLLVGKGHQVQGGPPPPSKRLLLSDTHRLVSHVDRFEFSLELWSLRQ